MLLSWQVFTWPPNNFTSFLKKKKHTNKIRFLEYIILDKFSVTCSVERTSRSYKILTLIFEDEFEELAHLKGRIPFFFCRNKNYTTRFAFVCEKWLPNSVSPIKRMLSANFVIVLKGNLNMHNDNTWAESAD